MIYGWLTFIYNSILIRIVLFAKKNPGRKMFLILVVCLFFFFPFLV